MNTAKMVADQLSRRAGHLDEDLVTIDAVSNEAGDVLAALCSKLRHLSNITAPIHTKAKALTTAQQNMKATKELADALVQNLDKARKLEPRIDAGPYSDLDAYLVCLSELEQCIEFMKARGGLQAARAGLLRAQNVHERGMHECESDFVSSLSRMSREALPPGELLAAKCSERFTEETLSGALMAQMLPEAEMPRLKRLATTMLNAKHFNHLDMYIQVREKCFDQSLKSVGWEPTSAGALLGLSTEQHERAAAKWSSHLRVATLLLVVEQRLAGHVWLSPYKDAVFAEIVHKHIRMLLASGAELADVKSGADKMFALLDMHAHLQEMQPMLRSVLSGKERVSGLLNDLAALRNSQAKTARVLFADFEDFVNQNPNKAVVNDGTVHPVCAYVLSFMKRMFQYKNAGPVLFGNASGVSLPAASPSPDPPPSPGGDATTPEPPSPGGGGDGGGSAMQRAMGVALMRVMMNLLDSLEAKSKSYRSDALANLFLMNNLHYMVWTVEKQPQALELLGKEWVERHKDFVEEYGAKYHNVVWLPLVKALKADNVPLTARSRNPAEALLSGDAGKLRAAVKERLKYFNQHFEAACSSQSQWTVPDRELREAVKRVIKTDLLPAYREFLSKYFSGELAVSTTKALRYAPEDVASIIDELFESKEVKIKERRKELRDARSERASESDTASRRSSRQDWR